MTHKPYNGLTFSAGLRSAFSTAERVAARTGRRHRVHQVHVQLADVSLRGWHICEIGACSRTPTVSGPDPGSAAAGAP